ncbi:MAG: PKD domain-containing protein, partial [Candidatus Thermoplasmatota archaeon]
LDGNGNLLWWLGTYSASGMLTNDGKYILIGLKTVTLSDLNGTVLWAYPRHSLTHFCYITKDKSKIIAGDGEGNVYFFEGNITEIPEVNITERGDWIKESGIRIADGSVPYIITLDDGRYRLYYNNPQGIFSAISNDGLNFVKEFGIRLTSTDIPNDPEWHVHGATVIRLDNGSYRMYYVGATGGGGPGEAIHRIFSAISTDGLNFTREGIRIESNGTIDRGWASVPEIVRTFDGKYRLYYCSGGGGGSAISDDGLNFVREYGPGVEKPTGVFGCDPAVYKIPNGTYRIFCTSPSGPMPPWYLEKGIYSCWSADGLDFTLEPGVRISPGGMYDAENVLDPTVIRLSNGTFRMYYGGSSRWGIITLSAVCPNSAPVIQSINVSPQIVNVGGSSTIVVSAFDRDGDILTYNYTVTAGIISGSGSTVVWHVPSAPGNYTILVRVNDSYIDSASVSTNITVGLVNHPPQITHYNPPTDPTIYEGTNITFNITAIDPDGVTLAIVWKLNGAVVGYEQAYTFVANYTSAGVYTVNVTVTDGEFYVYHDWTLIVADVNVITPEGGDISFENVKLEFPQNAVSANTKITITPISIVVPSGYGIVG